MAKEKKQKLVEIVKRGKTAIARWRKQNPDMMLNLLDAKLVQAKLREANLRRANLVGASMVGANLTGAFLTGADLTRADLRKANLTNAELDGAELFKATLRGAKVSGAILRNAKLSGTDLTQANLTRVNFTQADLSEADFSHAVLVGADLSKADLNGANFDHSVFGWTSLGNVDMSKVRGMEAVSHIGPSTIGIDTLYRSAGMISDVFLRGCGLPEDFIANMPALTENPIDSSVCFIRYAHEDASFVVRLHDALQDSGIRCWLDEMPPEPTDDIYKDVARGRQLMNKVLLCASKNTLSSWWSNDDLDRALDQERQLKKSRGQDVRILFPMNLDGFMFSGDWKYKKEKLVANRVAADFVGWRRNKTKFVEELEKLVEMLKPDPKKK